MAIKHLLIVDDDPINNIITQKRLSDAVGNLKMTVFEWASEALYQLENEPLPDLVLLDLNMPELTGWDFLEACQAQQVPIEIIILTSSIDERDKEKAKVYPNVKAFISKPLSFNKVKKIVQLI